MNKGNIIGKKNDPGLVKASGIWSVPEEFNAKYANVWPYSMSVTGYSDIVNEGVTINFVINSNGYNDGTYFWTIDGAAVAADFSPAAVSGSFVIAGSTGSITVSTVEDFATEGDQTFTLNIRADSIAGTILTSSNLITILDTSVPITATVVPDVSSINEGQTVNFAVTTTPSYTGTLYFSTNTVTGTVNAADFTTPLTGSFSVTGGSGSFGRTAATDGVNDGALIYVGGNTFFGSGTTNNITLSLTSLTGGTDASPQSEDLVIVAIQLSGGVNGVTTDKTYRISNYTQIADLYANNASFQDSNFQVGYRRMGGTPDTSATITGGTGSDADAYAAVVHVWRNVDPTTPLDVTPTTASVNNSPLPNPPAITPTTAGAVILVAAGASHSDGTDTFTAGYLSNFRTVGGNDTNDATAGMGSVAWTSGAYDPAAWTGSFGGTATNFSNNSVTFALRPNQSYTESFTMSVRHTSTAGTVVGTSTAVTIAGT